MFGLVVRFRLKDESAAAGFDGLMVQTEAGIRELEPGTLVYTSRTVADEPLQRILYELYDDRDAFDAHERQPHARRFVELRGQYLAGYEVEFATPLVNQEVDA